jgi:hypothetical protein
MLARRFLYRQSPSKTGRGALIGRAIGHDDIANSQTAVVFETETGFFGAAVVLLGFLRC